MEDKTSDVILGEMVLWQSVAAVINFGLILPMILKHTSLPKEAKKCHMALPG